MSDLDRFGAWAARATPGAPTAAGIRLLRFFVRPFVRVMFRPVASGWEKFPEGPCLIVANHSGGGVADVLCFAWLWLARFALGRPVTGMAHPLAFGIPIVAFFLRSFGACASTYEQAQAALARGVSVLVFPGGDHEAFRPLWQASRVDFAGRRGYLRIARRSWVPVVPLGIRGSHFTNPILWRSRALPCLLLAPRLAGLKRLPVTILWLAGLALVAWRLAPEHRAAAIAAGLAWTYFPFTHFTPWVPWKVRLRFGEPLRPEELFATRDESAPLDAAAERVEGAVQALVRA